MPKSGELAFRLNIFTNLKLIFGVASLSDMAAIAVLIGLGVADIAGESVAVNIV